MTASVPAASGTEPSEFELVESSSGWQLTMTLTDRLRDALAAGADGASLSFTVRVAPNLVPGEPFEATLRIVDSDDAARPAGNGRPAGAASGRRLAPARR